MKSTCSNLKKRTKKNNNLLFCVKCSNIPFITIIPSITNRVKIKCPCSTKIMLLEDYLHQVNYSNQSIKEHKIYCEMEITHFDKKAKGFCVQCKEYLCRNCIKKHKTYTLNNHQIILVELDYYTHEYPMISHDKNKRYYCFTCKKNFCYLCSFYEHSFHSTMNVLSIVQENIKEIRSSFEKVKKNYKNMLKNTLKNKKLPDMNAVILKNRECIKKNQSIIHLIEIILNNFSFFSEIQFSLYANLYTNTLFTIHDSHFKQLPRLNKRKDYLRFYSKFSIIKRNNIIAEYSRQYYTKLGLNWKSQVNCISKINNHTYALGDSEGNILILVLKVQSIFSQTIAHSEGIIQLLLIDREKLLSNSSQCIKLWKIQFMTLTYLKTFDIQFSYNSTLLSNNRFATITNTGILYILCIKNDDYKEVYESTKQDDCPFLYYIKRYGILIQSLDEYMSFFTLDPLTKDEKEINDIMVNSVNTFAETKEGKLIISCFYKSMKNPSIVVVNPLTKIIELVYSNYNAMYNDIEGVGYFFSLIDSDSKYFYLITTKFCCLKINKNNLNITKHIPLFNLSLFYRGALRLTKKIFVMLCYLCNSNSLVFIRV